MSKDENEDFIGLADFIEEIADVDYYLEDQYQNQHIVSQVAQVAIESPCQLNITVDDEGQVAIGAIPPMYYVSTSFMPVFHNIKITIDTIK